eukprot:111652-Chlamydomonas_euryale.AAC.3
MPAACRTPAQLAELLRWRLAQHMVRPPAGLIWALIGVCLDIPHAAALHSEACVRCLHGPAVPCMHACMRL